jgi:hypothetical protein
MSRTVHRLSFKRPQAARPILIFRISCDGTVRLIRHLLRMAMRPDGSCATEPDKPKARDTVGKNY